MRTDGLKPSNLALNSLINAFGEDQRDAEAFSVLQYMKENVSCHLHVIFSPCFLLSMVKVISHYFTTCPFGSLQLQGLKPDVVTYTTLMKALIRVDKFHKVLSC